MTLVYEHVDLAFGTEVPWQSFLYFGGKAIYICLLALTGLAAELMDEGTHKNGSGVIETSDQVRTTLCPIDLFFHAQEDLLNLIIKLRAVGNDQQTSVAVVLQNPFSQPDHGQGLAATLAVPDDATLSASNEILGCLDAEVLVVPTDLLCTRIKDYEIMDQFQ